MTNGTTHDRVLETTASCILCGAAAALGLITYGLLLVTGLLPEWLVLSASSLPDL